MRFIVADWGTTRFRGYLIENETILDQVSSDEGVSALQKGQHRDVFPRPCAAGRHGGKPRWLGRGSLRLLPWPLAHQAMRVPPTHTGSPLEILASEQARPLPSPLLVCDPSIPSGTCRIMGLSPV